MRFVRGFNGLGDNVLQRPFIKALKQSGQEFSFETPWPQLYSDIPGLRFVKPQIKWRTQCKNLDRIPPGFWVPAPSKHVRPIILQYGTDDLSRGNIIQAFESKIPLPDQRLVMDLPPIDAALPFNTNKPIAVIRPVTVRREWLNSARAPKPEYVSQIASELRKSGFFLVSVADVVPNEEWLIGDQPEVDAQFHAGELVVEQLVSLIRKAAVVVGGVGWIAPMCVAAQTPLFLIFGGNGAHNAPEKIFDTRMDLTKVGMSIPPNFCRCSKNTHQCQKEIPNLMNDWYAFLTRVKLA